MSPASIDHLSQLRDIGWSLWDPIGLRDVRDANNEAEYDRYLLHVASRLKQRDKVPEMVHYLLRVEMVDMALGASPTASAHTRATATVNAIKAYLDAHPD